MEKSVISIISLVTGISKEELIRKSSWEVWNSLHHVEIIISIEEEFGITFTPDEIAENKTVDGMIETVRRKVNV